MHFFVLLNTKEDILKNVGTEQFWGTIYFHSIFFSYYGSQWCPKTAWLQTFFKISSFVFSRTKKCIQVWNYLRVSKWWQNFHFWVNYPVKSFKWAITVKLLINVNKFIYCLQKYYVLSRWHNLLNWMSWFLIWDPTVSWPLFSPTVW